MGQQAVSLAIKGFHVIPICWPNSEGQCACPRKHRAHDIGKGPLTPRGINDSSKEIRNIWDWWQRWPEANIAVDLDRSGLIAIAPDSTEWHDRFLGFGLPETYTVQSGGGPGHVHYIYSRPENTPLINDNKPGQYDIQPRGYVVAEGSLHQSGRRYICISDFPWRDVADLPPAPPWVVERIKERWEIAAANAPLEIVGDLPPVPTRLTTGTLSAWWSGMTFVALPDGTPDRSATLLAMARMMARAGATPSEIVAGLRDRDEALGFHKYSRRRDQGRKAYSSMAQVAAKTLPVPGVNYALDPTSPETPPEEPSGWELLTRDLPAEEPFDFDWESYVVPRSAHDDQFKNRRAKLVATYRTLGEHVKANKLSHCLVDLRCRLWANGNEDLCPYHCGVVGCPNDIGRNVYLLLKEKREKLVILVEPAVYLAENVLMLAWPQDADEQAAVLKLGYRALHKLLDLWSARRRKPGIIRDCIQAFCSRVIETPSGKIVCFGLTLLANWSEKNLTLITNALRHRTPDLHLALDPYVVPVEDMDLVVTEHPFRTPSVPSGTDHLDAAIELFHKRASVPFDWNDPEDFMVWTKAMKGVKKVQGRGAFRAVTGNKPTGLAPTAAINYATGELDTFTWYKGKVYKREFAMPFRSEYTGETVLVFRPGYTKETCGSDPEAMPEDWEGGGSGP